MKALRLDSALSERLMDSTAGQTSDSAENSSLLKLLLFQSANVSADDTDDRSKAEHSHSNAAARADG